MNIETDDNGVAVERFDMVDEFLDSLRLADDVASGRRFLFRGVPNARLALLPSALRHPSPFEREPRSEVDQEQLEKMALRRFHDAAYFGGLTIPQWAEVQSYLQGGPEGLREYIREFIALAQHHGTPTRLLDWTLDPFVGAYFAASEYPDYEKFKDAPEMAVWWFDPSVTKAAGTLGPWSRPISIPLDVNHNARAQRGVFIEYRKNRTVGDGEIDRDSLIDIVKQWDERGGPPLLEAFKKFTLPRTKTKELLNTLRIRHRISASVLFPGYYGAAREERERCQVGDL